MSVFCMIPNLDILQYFPFTFFFDSVLTCRNPEKPVFWSHSQEEYLNQWTKKMNFLWHIRILFY